ncbi:DUF1661 domain-containing protein [Porphyromonas gulae]
MMLRKMRFEKNFIPVRERKNLQAKTKKISREF